MRPSLFKNQTGAAAVELALILPFLAILILGTVDMACLMYNKQILTNASREGARKAIVRPEAESEAQQVTKDYCENKLINWGGGSISITNDVKISPLGTTEEGSKEFREVYVSFAYNHLIDGFLGFSIGPTTLSGTSIMRRDMGKE
jgi:Flp pilus assembly protein TadG